MVMVELTIFCCLKWGQMDSFGCSHHLNYLLRNPKYFLWTRFPYRNNLNLNGLMLFHFVHFLLLCGIMDDVVNESFGFGK